MTLLYRNSSQATLKSVVNTGEHISIYQFINRTRVQVAGQMCFTHGNQVEEKMHQTATLWSPLKE